MEISRPDQYTARLNVKQDNKGFVSKNKKDNPIRIRGSAVVKDNKNFIFLNLNELPDFQTESVVLGHELAHILQDKKYEDIYKPLRKVIDVNFKKYFREEMSDKIELKVAETYPNLSK